METGNRGVLLALFTALAAGCAGPGHTSSGLSASRNTVPAAAVAGYSREGRPIECRIWGDGPVRVMIIATIHGDEPAGTPLLEALEKRLPEKPGLLRGRTVILVPVANPDGFEAASRGNARGVDLNRNFPADNFHGRDGHGPVPLSEPESRALDTLIRRHRPDRIISIHQPLNCVDYDGPAVAHALAKAMSRSGNVPLRKLGDRPGSLGAYAGADLGIPLITLELPGRVPHGREALWERYGPIIVAAIRYPEPTPETAAAVPSE